MHYLSIITSLLPFLLTVVQAQADCPAGYEAVEDPRGTGNYRCIKVEWTCPGGDERKYVNAVSQRTSLSKSHLFPLNISRPQTQTAVALQSRI